MDGQLPAEGISRAGFIGGDLGPADGRGQGGESDENCFFHAGRMMNKDRRFGFEINVTPLEIEHSWIKYNKCPIAFRR